jgi:hypothetical protein
MTTQKITSTLNAAGFKAFHTVSEKVNGVRRPVRKGDFNSFKLGNMIGVETYGVKTSEMIAALVANGINAKETATGSGMIKIA